MLNILFSTFKFLAMGTYGTDQRQRQIKNQLQHNFIFKT